MHLGEGLCHLRSIGVLNTNKQNSFRGIHDGSVLVD
jgi:hypothetical protein